MTIAVFFAACKDDGITVTDQGKGFDPGTTPDVYVENGYLAFKDLSTVDSVFFANGDRKRAFWVGMITEPNIGFTTCI